MKVAKNYLYNLIYEAVALIVPLVLTPYISRVLMVDGVGKYTLSTAILSYFILFGMLGINVYGNRQVAYTRDDNQKLRETFWEINVVKTFSMGISIAIYFLFVAIYIENTLKSIYFANIFTLLASLIDISWFFIGTEDFKSTTIKNCAVKIVSVVLVIILVKKPQDIALYALIISLSTFIGQVCLWASLPKNIRHFGINKNQIKYHFRNTAKLWLPSLATTLYASLDKIMLGYMIDDIQVGLYESAQKLVRMASMITTSFATASLPQMSNFYNNKRDEDMKALANSSISLVLFLSVPICFGMLGISRSVVPWFFGTGYEEVSNLLLINSWILIILALSSIYGQQILISCNKEKLYTKAVLVDLIANCSLNVILIPIFLAKGALIASVLSELVCLMIMMNYSKKCISVLFPTKELTIYIVAAAMMGIIVFFIGEVLGYRFYTTIIQIIVGASFYFLCMYLIKDKNVIYVNDKIKKIITKKD